MIFTWSRRLTSVGWSWWVSRRSERFFSLLGVEIVKLFHSPFPVQIVQLNYLSIENISLVKLYFWYYFFRRRKLCKPQK